MNKIAIVKQGADGKWYITIRNKRNHKTLADGAEGYATKATGKRALQTNFGDGYWMMLVRETPTELAFEMRPHA